MTDFTIRLARPEDAEAFHTVEEDAADLLRQEPSLQDITIPPSSDADEYRSMIRAGHSLAALVNDTIVGFAAARAYGRELHLHEMSVAIAHQGKRIGATLLKALQIDARNAGLQAITLNTFRDIPWNAPFYARHGFVIVEDIEAHPRLADSLERAAAAGLPVDRRCSMICFLD